MVRAGIGDVVNNLSAIADWELAAADTRRARRRARRHAGPDRRAGGAAPAGHGQRRRVPHRAGRGAGAVRDRDDGGRVQPARAAAATTRSCTPSTSCTPAPAATASWPASARCSAPTCAATPAARRSSPPAWPGTACRGRPPTSASATPSSPRPSLHAPATRPGRYTILERLALDECAIAGQVEDFAVESERVCPGQRWLSCAPRASRPTVLARLNDEHWFGRLYMRRLSPYATWMFARLGWSPNAVTVCFMVCGVAAGRAHRRARAARGRRGSPADPALSAVRLLRRRAGPVHRPVLRRRHLPGPDGPLHRARRCCWPASASARRVISRWPAAT